MNSTLRKLVPCVAITPSGRYTRHMIAEDYHKAGDLIDHLLGIKHEDLWLVASKSCSEYFAISAFNAEERGEPINMQASALVYTVIAGKAVVFQRKDAIHVFGEGVVDMKWQPWEDFKINPDLSDRITKPPCSKCQFWHPQINEFTRLPNGMIIFNGVTCCLSDVMHHDFSCFRAKGD